MHISIPGKKFKYLILIFLMECSVITICSAIFQVKDSVIYKPHTISGEDLVRGERLFYGLVYLENKSTNCASCHNTSVSDTLNWNPDALEISKKYLNKNPVDLARVLLKPVGQKMIQVHKGIQLNQEEIGLIKAFMDRLVVKGLKQNKPVITYLLLLIIASVLLLFSTIDLIIGKIFNKHWINWMIISIASILITYILAIDAIAFGRSKGYSPEQPIKFSHAVHAGQNKIDCIYCHSSAKISKTAGIPPGNVCLNCHLIVRNGTRSGTTEIAKVLSALDNKKPLKWIRIYRLPDFVFFSHAQHVSAGGIDCVKCHGDVKTMHRLYQVPDLSMGWCIRCHDSRKVNFSNEYYKTYYPDLYDSLRAGKADSIMASVTGGRDCGRCHY